MTETDGGEPGRRGPVFCRPSQSIVGVLEASRGLYCDCYEGRQTHYSAQLGALSPLIDWTSQMAGFWQNRFDRLEDLLRRMDQ